MKPLLKLQYIKRGNPGQWKDWTVYRLEQQRYERMPLSPIIITAANPE